MMLMSSSTDSGNKLLPSIKTSLASLYVIQIHDQPVNEELQKKKTISSMWRLLPIQNSTPSGVGAIAIQALQSGNDKDSLKTGGILLHCKGYYNNSKTDVTIQVDVEEVEDFQKRDENLKKIIALLSRVMLQYVVTRIAQKDNVYQLGEKRDKQMISVTLPSQNETDKQPTTERIPLSRILSQNGCALLFASLLSPDVSTKSLEMSEMVDSNGCRLGCIPRSLVHKFNVLHRGIGVVICRDAHITRNIDENCNNNLHNIYVHKRTDTKQIFPSLYDMFVGGVSTAGEEPRLTAAREVAEELGLTRALRTQLRDIEDDAALSDPLFSCIVCTAYNRCVVTVFTYKYVSGKEIIKWQEEEVAWGEFVPYDIVNKAASLSKQRIKNNGNWPGTVKSMEHEKKVRLSTEKGDQKTINGNKWHEWDFVPDGLLVWEAWVSWMDKRSTA